MVAGFRPLTGAGFSQAPVKNAKLAALRADDAGSAYVGQEGGLVPGVCHRCVGAAVGPDDLVPQQTQDGDRLEAKPVGCIKRADRPQIAICDRMHVNKGENDCLHENRLAGRIFRLDQKQCCPALYRYGVKALPDDCGLGWAPAVEEILAPELSLEPLAQPGSRQPVGKCFGVLPFQNECIRQKLANTARLDLEAPRGKTLASEIVPIRIERLGRFVSHACVSRIRAGRSRDGASATVVVCHAIAPALEATCVTERSFCARARRGVEPLALMVAERGRGGPSWRSADEISGEGIRLSMGDEADDPAGEPMFNVPPMVLALLALMIAVMGLRWALDPDQDTILVLTLALIPARLAGLASQLPGGEPAIVSQFLTHMFVHADTAHLMFNGASLLAFAGAIEKRIGSMRTLLYFVTCGLAGAFTFLIINPGLLAPMIGASGAIAGMMGGVMRFFFSALDHGGLRQLNEAPQSVPLAPLVAALRDQRLLVVTAAFILMNIAAMIGLGDLNADGAIAWEAHIGGYLAGLFLFGLFDVAPRHENSRQPLSD